MSSMLAVATTDALTLIEAQSVKRASSSTTISPSHALLSQPTGTTWSQDNSSLFFASSRTIQRYDAASNTIHSLYTSSEEEPIAHLVAKDKGSTLIFNQSHRIHVLEYGSPNKPKISQTFESHKAPITSLSFSSDFTLLASTSAGAAHVHNLSMGSHTVLRGLSVSSQSVINTCVFHPHSRTRLLLGIGSQLVVYDTTRPSGPIKTVPMSTEAAGHGDIVAIACSPFSKTLVAVSTLSGYVGLIDLDKEKGLFRSITLSTPLTSSLSFSPEGAAIYLGSENGKLLILDLRSLDKPPRSITIGTDGMRVESISVQKKTKGAPDPVTKSNTTTTTAKSVDTKPETVVANSKPIVVTKKSDVPVNAPTRRPSGTVNVKPAAPSKAAPTSKPTRARLGSGTVVGNGPTASPARALRTTSTVTSPPPKVVRSTSKTIVSSPKIKPTPTTTTSGPHKKAEIPGTKHKPSGADNRNKVFSPVRDPLGNSHGGEGADISVQLENLGMGIAAFEKGTTPTKTRTRSPAPPSTTPPLPRVSGSTHTRKASGSEKPARVRTTSTTSTTSRTAAAAAATDSKSEKPARVRTGSSASRAPVATAAGDIESISGRLSVPLRRPRTGSSASRAGTESAISAVGSTRSRSSARLMRERDSRTPSPDLPDINNVDPMTPIPGKKKATMGVLGLGTPDVDRWIQAGKEKQNDIKGKGKSVGFQEDSGSESDEDEDVDDEKERQRERSLTMQISPRRPSNSATYPSSMSAASRAASASWAPVPSPLLRSASHSQQHSSPHELLRTIVQDVMYDFQRDTKAEMMGLHLDLVRMGRGWKKELREAMGEYGDELRDLREENTRLREENERLRRGY